MKKYSNMVNTVVAAFMVVVVVVVSYLIIVYGMLRDTLTDRIEQNLHYGLGNYYELKNYEEAEKYFKRALFSEKYIVFWNNNLRLPKCYQCLGLVYEGMEDYAKSVDMYEKSLSAYEKYMPEALEDIALTHTKASVIYFILGDNGLVIEHAGIANDYYQALSENQQDINAATAAIWLANAYYNICDYGRAAQYFEIGIPILYDEMSWSMDDVWGPKTLVCSYKMAAETYEKLNNGEMQKYYVEQFENIVWMRNIEEEEIDELMEYFQWGKDEAGGYSLFG